MEISIGIWNKAKMEILNGKMSKFGRILLVVFFDAENRFWVRYHAWLWFERQLQLKSHHFIKISFQAKHSIWSRY